MPVRVGGFLRVVWRDLPVLWFPAAAALIAQAEAVFLRPARPDLLVTFLFPLAVPAAMIALRRGAAHRPARLAELLAVAVALAVALVSSTVLSASPRPAGVLRRAYEASTLGACALFCIHAWTLDRRLLASLLGPAALYGVLLENGGILLGYFKELHYTLYVPGLPAPVATMAGWVMVFYLSMWVTWEVQRAVPALRRRVWLSAGVAAAAALLFDVQLDPLATAVGFWTWHEALPAGPFAVPVINFVAWACAVYPFAWLVLRTERRGGLGPGGVADRSCRRRMWLAVPVVLAGAAAAFLAVTAVVEGGFSGPGYRILGAALTRLWPW